MPNLRYMISSEEHREGCHDHEVKRLYIRETNDHGQVFVPWGYTCVCCGIIKYDLEWHEKNEARYETAKRRIPIRRRKYE